LAKDSCVRLGDTQAEQQIMITSKWR